MIMHTAVAPKGTLLDPATYDDVVAEVVAFLRERIDVALAAGVRSEQLILDPGPDFAKTPGADGRGAAAAGRCCARSGGRSCSAVSRKDFVGAITGPRARGARCRGRWRRSAEGVDAGASILRVHDVAAARDYLAVRAVLRGRAGARRARGAVARSATRTGSRRISR